MQVLPVPPVMPADPPLGVPAEPPEGVPALPPEGVPAVPPIEPALPPFEGVPALPLEPDVPELPPVSPSSSDPPDAPPQLATTKTRSAEKPKPTVPKDLTFAITGEPYAEERGLSRTPELADLEKKMRSARGGARSVRFRSESIENHGRRGPGRAERRPDGLALRALGDRHLVLPEKAACREGTRRVALARR